MKASRPTHAAKTPALPPATWQPPLRGGDNGVALAVWRACITELLAIKPGNVGLHGDGHGMRADDFARSAAIAAPILARPNTSVGERVRDAVLASYEVAGCNINLGIVLLCAPLCSAAQQRSKDLRTRLVRVLDALDVHDTSLVFEAVRIAQPAGLGSSPRHDVNSPAAAGLLDVMREAAHRDRIAYQYTHAFEDVLDYGLIALDQYLRGWPGRAAHPEWPLTWPATGVFLHFLARFADTHIYRKLGARVAYEVRARARREERRFAEAECAADVEDALLGFDRELKGEGINPGTSADLTVATLATYELERRQGARHRSLELRGKSNEPVQSTSNENHST